MAALLVIAGAVVGTIKKAWQISQLPVGVLLN
jgi:hypothetical protein